MSPSADSCAPANIATRVRPARLSANGAKPTSSPARSATTTYGSLAKAASANQASTQAENRYGLGRGMPSTSVSQAVFSCATALTSVSARTAGSGGSDGNHRLST